MNVMRLVTCKICGKQAPVFMTTLWSGHAGYDDQPELNGMWCDTCTEHMNFLEEHEGPIHEA